MPEEMKPRKGFSSDEGVIEDVLRKGEVLHLALKDNDGVYSVPVNYGFKRGAIYIHSSKTGRKISALALGEEVGFSVLASHEVKPHEKPCKWGCSFSSVVGCGVPRLLEEREKIAALNLIMGQYSDEKWEIEPSAASAIEVVEIMITTATARIVGRE